MPEYTKWVKKNRVSILLALIVLFGFVLRIWMLGNTPLWVDETISGLAAEGILHHGVPVLGSGMFYARALLYHYVEAGFLFVLGHSDFAARLGSVVFGLLTIVLAYLIGREFDKPVGLIAALFTSVLYLEVLYSRQARFYQLFQLLFFLTIYLLYKCQSKKSEGKKYAWLASGVLAICVQTHTAGLVLVPFVLGVFYMTYGLKDWKLFIVPLLVGVYFGASFLGIGFGSGLASSYAENYSSILFDSLAGFLLLSLCGLPFAYKTNKKLLFLIVVPSIVLFVGLFFIKVFALRYAYFVVLAMILLLANLFGYLYKQNRWLFAIALVFAIVYPSNLVFDSNYFTVVMPTDVHTTSSTEPIIDYKSLNASTRELILSGPILAVSTPGVEWYLKRPEFFVPFSLNGLKTGYALYNGRDAYTGATAFNGDIANFVLLEDAFGTPKLNADNRHMLNVTRQECTIIQKTYGLNVYSCSISWAKPNLWSSG